MIAFRFVVRKCTTANARLTEPAVMGQYADPRPKPSSAALEKPTIMSAEPVVTSALGASGGLAQGPDLARGMLTAR